MCALSERVLGVPLAVCSGGSAFPSARPRLAFKENSNRCGHKATESFSDGSVTSAIMPLCPEVRLDFTLPALQGRLDVSSPLGGSSESLQ